MSVHESNPAGRLFLYFRHVCGGAANQPIHVFAAGYFGLPQGFTAPYVSACAQLLTLPDEVEAQASLLESPTPWDVLIRPLGPVRALFLADPLGSQAVQAAVNEITPGVLSDLEHLSYALSTLSGINPKIDEDTLSQIRDLAEEIIRLAREDDSLDPDTQEAFIRFGRRITEAADLYKVRGAQPLVDELDRFHQECRRMKMPERGSKIWGSFSKLTGIVIAAAALFTTPIEVAHAIEEYSAVFEMPVLTETPGPYATPGQIVDAEAEDDTEQQAI